MAASLFHEPDPSVNRIQVICSSNERRSYEKRSAFFVHPLFNGHEAWPMCTDLVCRYDGEPFASIPLPLPIEYDAETNTYVCYGVFCSAACVKAFMESNPVYSNALSMIWLKKIMCEIFGDFDDIVEAPPVELLLKHGGELTIEQFRKFGQQKTRIITHRLPFFTCALAFELVKDYEERADASNKVASEHTTAHVAPPSDNTTKKLSRSAKKKGWGTQVEDPWPILSMIQPAPGTAEDHMTLPAMDDVMSTDPLPPQIAPVLGNVPLAEPLPPDADPLLPSDVSSTLLPDTITLIPANTGNRWEIRGLKRPAVPLNIPTPVPQPNTKPLFQDYVEKRLQQKAKPAAMLVAPNEGQLPKRRGRPKATTRVKVDSPQHTTQGTLISFLKTK